MNGPCPAKTHPGTVDDAPEKRGSPRRVACEPVRQEPLPGRQRCGCPQPCDHEAKRSLVFGRPAKHPMGRISLPRGKPLRQRLNPRYRAPRSSRPHSCGARRVPQDLRPAVASLIEAVPAVKGDRHWRHPNLTSQTIGRTFGRRISARLGGQHLGFHRWISRRERFCRRPSAGTPRPQ